MDSTATAPPWFDRPHVGVELDAVDLRVATERGQEAAHAFAERLAFAIEEAGLPCVGLSGDLDAYRNRVAAEVHPPACAVRMPTGFFACNPSIDVPPSKHCHG